MVLYRFFCNSTSQSLTFLYKYHFYKPAALMYNYLPYVTLLILFTPLSSFADDMNMFKKLTTQTLPLLQKNIREIVTFPRSTKSSISERETRDGSSTSCVLELIQKFDGINAVYATTQYDVVPKNADTHKLIIAYGKNSRYYFELVRAKKSTGWLTNIITPIDKLATATNKDTRPVNRFTENVSVATDDLTKVVFAGVKYFPEDLPKLPDMRLKSVTIDKTAGTADIAFDYTPVNKVHPERKDISCDVRYSLASGIVIGATEYSGPTSNPGVRKRSNQLKLVDSQRFNYTINNTINSIKNGRLVYSSENTAEVETVFGSVPESEFTLTAFGLPEPPEFQPKPTPLYVWLLLAAGVCAVVAIGFRLLARRRAA